MSSFDQDQNSSPSTQTGPQEQPTSPPNLPHGMQESVQKNSPQTPKTGMFSWKTAALGIIGAIAVLYSTLDFDEPSASTEAEIARINAFDSRLLSCNDVKTSAPTESYDICLSVAEEGQVLAIKRLIWAYSRKSDYQDLGKVFEWLRALPYKDSATQLLMFSLVHLNAESDELKKDSELGISRLVAKNYAPANVVLASIYALDENTVPPSSNALWLLKRANKKDPLILDPSLLALIHANGFVGDVNIAAGTSLLKNSADQGFPMATNNIAWFLATLDSNPFTPSKYAVSLAQRVVDDPVHGQNPVYVDTLAATLAAHNMFEKAKTAQQQALQLLTDANFSESVLERTQNEYKERLTLYSQNEALVEDTLVVDKTTFFKRIRNRALEYVLREFFITIEAPILSSGKTIDINSDQSPQTTERTITQKESAEGSSI